MSNVSCKSESLKESQVKDLLSDEGIETDEPIHAINMISYYIAKTSLETSDGDKAPTFINTGIKCNDTGEDIYNLNYTGKTPGGYLGQIGAEMSNITVEGARFANLMNPKPDCLKIKCGNETTKHVFTTDWERLKNQLKNKCIPVTEGFSNNENNYKKDIYKLYLLGFGSLMVFLLFKLFFKKNKII